MRRRRKPRSSSSRPASPGPPGRGRSGRSVETTRRTPPSLPLHPPHRHAEYWTPVRRPESRLPPKKPPSYCVERLTPDEEGERRVERRCVSAVEAGGDRDRWSMGSRAARAPLHLTEHAMATRILDAQVEWMALDDGTRLGRCGGDGTARGTSERPTAVTGDRQGRHRAHDRETRLDSSPSHHQAQHPTGTADRSGPGRRSSAQAPRGRWLRPVPRRPPAGGRGPGAQSTTLRSRRS